MSSDHGVDCDGDHGVDCDGDHGVDGGNNPPGFRFFPTEEELLGFYLKNKLEKKRENAMETVIPVLDIYRFDPWQLPRDDNNNNSCNKKCGQWFFFCPRREREVHGGRPARTTPSGYWKATGTPSLVYSSSNREPCRVLGEKKTMVFYVGRAPRGRKTEWKMNEYRALEEDAATLSNGNPKLRKEFSVCRVYLGSVRSFDRRPEASSPTVNRPAPQPDASSSSASGNDNVSRQSHAVEAGEEAAFDWDDGGLLDWDWGMSLDVD